MRLISVYTFEVKEFTGEPSGADFPRYAILSHTWGPEEVSFQDIQDLDSAKQKQGFDKIRKCCEQARNDGLEWAWVDTCCIDKTSSAELSESINSMFKWYEASTICYAFLMDIESWFGFDKILKTGRPSQIVWFTRGWTLQELIAPLRVTFFSTDWKPVGAKHLMSEKLSHFIGVPASILERKQPLSSIPVLSRMQWARGRVTTRKEDLAYCLLGIFDVHMPLVYGEGGKAFNRLQAEILRSTSDYTILLGSLDQHVDPVWSSGELMSVGINPDDYEDVIRDSMVARPDNSDTTFVARPSEDVVFNPPDLRETALQMTIPLFMISDDQHKINSDGSDPSCGICIGALSCLGPDQESLVARYFVYNIPQISDGVSMVLKPLIYYCFVSLDNVRRWPFKGVIISLSPTHHHGGIHGELMDKRPENDIHLFGPLKCTKLDVQPEPLLDYGIFTFQAYRIWYKPTRQTAYLYMYIAEEDSTCHVYFGQQQLPERSVISNIYSHGWVHSAVGAGLVLEDNGGRIPIRGGSAELVVSVFASFLHGLWYYSLELRFKKIILDDTVSEVADLYTPFG
ncbi:heterokaryon incompatibility protein-domain-containing protein [Camillea tinctor]|nr:heterokaryon incompatibility protein-domain-containing protein [Camillea tinctor]